MIGKCLHYLRILKGQEHPLKFLISRILWRSGLSKFLLIKRNGYVLRFYPTSLSAAYWMRPDERRDDEKFFQDYLIDGDVVIDIGANIGALSIVAAMCVGKSGKVFTFEPHPKVAMFLRRNVEENGLCNVKIHNLALGEKSGSVYFSNSNSDDQNSVISSASEAINSFRVQVVTLDQVLPLDQSIALMKIDVEGYEKFVLQGARISIEMTNCIYFESWDYNFSKFGYSTQDILALLRSAGFSIYKLSTSDRKAVLVSGDYASIECENLVGVRNAAEFVNRTGYVLA